jgi:hypothetical protein
MAKVKGTRCFTIPLMSLISMLGLAGSIQAQRCNKSPEDIKFVREMKDVGADLAVVVAEQSTIYEQPSAASKALLRVKRANFLALVKRDAVRTWYRVIEVDSATEGWIDECDVILKLTDNRESGPPLEEERVGTTQDPELSVANLEARTNLNLRLNGSLYVIPANTTKTFTLKPGKYEFYGYSPGVRPAFGNENFQAGFKYRWTFKIVVQ